MLLVIPGVTQAAENGYNPPFEIYGVVSDVMDDSIEVFIPKIGKTVSVTVSAKTRIVDNKEEDHELAVLKENDLVTVFGTISNDTFQGETISFFSVSVQ